MTNQVNRGDVFGKIIMGIALVVFVGVAFLIVGGWLFSVAWNAVVGPVFGLADLDIMQGLAFIVLFWLIGIAMGFRRSINVNTD